MVLNILAGTIKGGICWLSGSRFEKNFETLIFFIFGYKKDEKMLF
jgi:hypothetical protein